MNTGEVTIPYPAGLEESVQTTPGEVQQQIRLMAALKMFELVLLCYVCIDPIVPQG
jgi:hypothetical protein